MKKLIIVFALLIGCLLGFLYWAHLLADDHSSYIVNNVDALSEARSRTTLKIVTFNIAYGRGREDDIVVGPKSEKTIRENLDRISRLLKNTDADIVLLQEVDLASKRTHFIDEAKYLADGAGYSTYACITNWIKNYIPFPYWPPSWHFGKMKSGQCIMSKFPIISDERIALPQRRDKPFFYTAFYMDRAIQVADVVIDGEHYKIFNVHQEAFDIQNREEQTEILARLINGTSTENMIVGGDFNAIPPGATMKKGFPDDPEKEDVSGDRSLELFTSSVTKLTEVFPEDFQESETFTFPSNAPNRHIDYIFFSKDLLTHRGEVIRDAGDISDHLPVCVELELKKLDTK